MSELRLLSILTALAAACGGPKPVDPGPTPAPEPFERPQLLDSDTARPRYTEADVHFMQGMIPHHAQAIVMSRLAETNGASEPVQVLAARIINAQQDEIATAQRWLRDRGQTVPEAKPGPMRMKMNGVEHEMMMPGTLTDDQLRQLQMVRGSDFDWLFITSMIQHHRGAVQMVKDLFATPGAALDDTVFKFASDVHVDQITEINRMVKLLATLPSGPGS